MLRIFLGMSVIVGILAFSACSRSNTTDVIQPVKTANVADNPARENVPAKEVVVEEPAPVKDLSQDTKPPSPLQIGGWLVTRPRNSKASVIGSTPSR